MKKVFLLAVVAGALGFVSCDHVDNPYPPAIVQGDYGLYPDGDSAHYAQNAKPTFSANTNTLRNLLIEDFTGHKCTFCPPAADTAHSLHNDYGDRVLISTIHAGPTGIGFFQTPDASMPIDWTNPDGLAIGEYFGTLPGSSFVGNPSGTISRILLSGDYTVNQFAWRPNVIANLSSSLKVNLQSAVNYYPSTRGLFIHAEVDILDNALNADDLYTVIYLQQDSLVAKQKMSDNSTNDNYVHRDIMRGCIGSDWKGHQVSSLVQENGKYYLDYIYELPDGPGDNSNSVYDPAHTHLLIYVRDANTQEIYQVIKQKLQ